MRNWWHKLLLFLSFRDEFDWAPPGLGPEVNHPYSQHESLNCCEHCGGGRRHPIHSEPYNPRRLAECQKIAIEKQAMIEAARAYQNVLADPPYPMQGRAQYPRPGK